MGKIDAYMELLSKTYDEAIAYLLGKYGPAPDDYYREASYKRFMKEEIKSITKGNYSRTREGLYCHHIDENKALKISDKDFIKMHKIPFAYQKKERLVYCDLIEHTVLHVLITKETSNAFGMPGYYTYLKPMIINWYIKEQIPKPQWMQNCYHKALVTPDEAASLIREMEGKLG